MTEEVKFKHVNPFVPDPNDPPKGHLAYEREPTICTKCIFYQKYRYYHTCIAKVRPATDFITGKKKLGGFRPCKDANTDGKCPDYKGNEAWTVDE